MKTRLLLFVFCALANSIALADADASATWDLDGFAYNGLTGESIVIDFEVGINAIAANGFVTYSDGLSTPTTGSCFFAQDDFLFCSLSLEYITVNLDIDLLSLEGEGFLVDQNGDAIGSGDLFFVQIEEPG